MGQEAEIKEEEPQGARNSLVDVSDATMRGRPFRTCGSIPMCRFGVLLVLVALVALQLLRATAFGAAPPAPAPAQPTAQQAIEPIGAGEILTRADIDERFLKEVMTQAHEPDPAQELVAPLEALAARIRKLSERYSRRELQSLPLIELEGLDRYWKFYDRRLSVWRHELNQVTSRYSDAAAKLAKRRAVWEATRVAGATSGLAPAVRNRVNAVLTQIVVAGQVLSGPLNSQLALAKRGNFVREDVDSARNAVLSAFTDISRRLLEINAPPIYKVWSDEVSSEQVLPTLTRGFKTESEFLAEYQAAYVSKHRVFIIVALLLLPALLWVSRRTRKLVVGDGDSQSSAHVLRRPISSWLLVVLVGLLQLEPDSPVLLLNTALLLLLIPVLRLLPLRAYAVLGSWPYSVVAVYALYQLGFLLVGTSLVGRLHLLVTAGVTFAALLGFLMRLRRQAGTPLAAAHSTGLLAVGWLFVVALLVGLVANVVGNVSLSEAMTGGVVRSAYIGLGLYAATALFRAILKLLLTSPAVSRFRNVTWHTEGSLRILGQLLNIGAFATWVVVTLKVFLVYRPVAGWVNGVLKQTLDLGQISITVGGVLVFLVSIWVSFWLAKTIRFVLQEELLRGVKLQRGVSNSIATLAYYAVVIIGLMVALVAAGFQFGQLAIVLGALGVGIGFGLQNVVNNVVSGLILMFERPMRPGDVIEVSGMSGTVGEIGMRATRIRTFDGADVVVPNGTLLSDKLTNWTLRDMSRRFEVNVGVAYGNDLKRVLELLMDTAKTTPGVSASPETMVIFIGFGASSLDFCIRAWTNDIDNWVAIRSDLTVRVYGTLMAAGIEIPFPQQDLHLRSISPEARAGITGTKQ